MPVLDDFLSCFRRFPVRQSQTDCVGFGIHLKTSTAIVPKEAQDTFCYLFSWNGCLCDIKIFETFEVHDKIQHFGIQC